MRKIDCDVAAMPINHWICLVGHAFNLIKHGKFHYYIYHAWLSLLHISMRLECIYYNIEMLNHMTEHRRDYAEEAASSYTSMLIQQEQIPWSQSLLAGIFSWMFLAASFMFPGSYLTSPYATAVSGAIRPVTRASFLVLAAVCFGIGLSGQGYLWYRWRKNYVWISNKLFL
jgi:hypothetical protein